MGDGESSGNTGVIAILVIFIIVVVLGFLAFRGGMFGGGSGKTTKVDINVGGSAPAR